MSTDLMTGPPRVQIQTLAGCNGRCVFCPNEATIDEGLELGRMPVDMFQNIIDQLAETGPRRVSLYLQNEPMADKRLPELTEYVSRKIPETTTLVTTNGTYLTEDRAEALIDSGLKRLKVSLQSLDPENNKKLMGYSSEKVIENVINTAKLIKRKRAKTFDFRVSMLVTSINGEEIDQARKFWRKHGVRLVTSALENRGGNIKDAGMLNAGEMKSMGNCIRPSREMCILYNGDVVLCCVDWFRTVVGGNVVKTSVKEVWNGMTFGRIREGLAEGNREKLPDICVNCTESACPNKHRRGLKGILSRLAAAI